MTNIEPLSLIGEGVFSALPKGLASDLVKAFTEILTNYSQGRWEPAELNGGKLCEAAYCICKGLCEGSFPERAKKPARFPQACQDLEKFHPQASRSASILIPRMLVPLYEVRNNRGVGHAGGDVDPNHMDATCVLYMSKWVVAELVRHLNDLPVERATEVVDALVERETPLVWKVNGKRRVLDASMLKRDAALLLLHGCAGAVHESELVGWVEYSNPSMFRSKLLKVAHRDRLVEYDDGTGMVDLSPLGVKYVEDNLIGGVG